MSSDQKLNMALDEIIKTGKKARASPRGAKAQPGGRRGRKAPAMMRSAKRVPKKGTPGQRVGKIAQRALQMKQKRVARAFGKRPPVANTARLVNRLVKKALTQSGRLTQARRLRTPVTMRAAAVRQQNVTPRRSTNGPSKQLRSRLGWMGSKAARGGAKPRGAANARGRFGGNAHMDNEIRQRANRAQLQRRLAQQQRAQQINARVNIRGQRRGGAQSQGFRGGAQANTAQFIRNTVFKAMAEASMSRMAPVIQQPMQGRRGGRGLRSRGALQSRSYNQMGGMRGFDNGTYMQHRPQQMRQRMRPMQQQSFFSGQSFDSPQPFRGAFSRASAGRTLDERFGGGLNRIQVQSYF